VLARVSTEQDVACHRGRTLHSANDILEYALRSWCIGLGRARLAWRRHGISGIMKHERKVRRDRIFSHMHQTPKATSRCSFDSSSIYPSQSCTNSGAVDSPTQLGSLIPNHSLANHPLPYVPRNRLASTHQRSHMGLLRSPILPSSNLTQKLVAQPPPPKQTGRPIARQCYKATLSPPRSAARATHASKQVNAAGRTNLLVYLTNPEGFCCTRCTSTTAPQAAFPVPRLHELHMLDDLHKVRSFRQA
jgi:hypothetical protein